MKIKTLLTMLLGTLFLSVAAQAQLLNDRFEFDPDLNYNSSITSPADFLGYELGEEYTHHYQLGQYLHHLAEQSDRVSIKTYGKTYENRELWVVIVTSERNQTMLEGIKENNLKLADATALNNTAADMLIESHPATVWLSYSVHGNEASTAEAALQTAYRLAAAEDAETQRFREEAVIVIDPILNPDGRDRYITWYKSSQANILNTDYLDLEHDEIWPGGRSNHYWFDLNRDWVWLIHPESQGRIAEYQQWMPQVHLDIHEQGFNDNYFTMPGTTPRNLMLPDNYESWTDRFGQGTIAEFDKHNVNYATTEAFDFFYPGYGSSYPSLMGSIGMLAEQGGHSRGGRAVETEDGHVLTLRQRIFDHYKNSVATVRVAVENRTELLSYYRDALNPENSKSPNKAYILPDNPNDHTYDVIDLMLKQGVTVERATENFSLRNAYNYWDGTASNRSFSDGDFIIKTDQTRHLFINTLFSREMAIEDSVMYDMSSWAIPLAYNLDAAWVTQTPDVNSMPLEETPERESGVVNPSASYAFVIDYAQPKAPAALAELWRKEYNVRSAEKVFTKDGVTFHRGSFIVLIGRNYDKRNDIRRDMQDVAEKSGVTIHGLNTGRMDSGMDLASRSSTVLHKPNVALLIDEPFSSLTAGQIWFQFDRNVEFGISRLRSHRLSSIDLSRYDVIIMPGMRGSSPKFGEKEMEAIKKWVHDGGTLVAAEQSALNLADGRAGLLKAKLNSSDPDTGDSEEIDPAAFTPYEARIDTFGLRRTPGAAFKAHVDVSNPLAFGVKDRIYSLTFNTDQYIPSTSYQVVGYYQKEAGELLAAGYSSQKNIDKAAGNVFAGVASVGSGKVAFLSDNTQYRMFWVGPERFMINAVMLLHSM